MSTWFTSDLHVSHARINELACRPFSSVEQADQTMIDNWNSIVSDSDTVFVLGDLAMGQFTESMQKAAKLRGMKFLVPGNHDRVSGLYPGSLAKKLEWMRAYKAAGFVVLPEQTHVTLSNGLRVLLCHFPYTGDSHENDRYTDSRPLDTGDWLLHGHTHSREKVRDRQVHVGVDAWSFAPVPDAEIVRLIGNP